jgi:hypothetical protein
LIPRVQEYQQKADLCDDEPINPPSRLRKIWPAFAVGVGLLAALVWVVLFLSWLIGHAVLAIL